jgi:hypothetical protein
MRGETTPESGYNPQYSRRHNYLVVSAVSWRDLATHLLIIVSNYLRGKKTLHKSFPAIIEAY